MVALRGATGRSTAAYTSSSYWVLDLSANYQIEENLRAYAKIYNLTNRAYELRSVARTQGVFPMAIPNHALQSKDLITTGIFSTLFFIVTMLSGAVFASNPVLTFLTPVMVALFTGPVHMRLAKVPKRGPTIILGAIMGLLMFVTGMFWLWSLAYVVVGFIAGKSRRRTSFKA